MGGIMRNNTQALLRLQTWLSPAFPIGSFAYSHGLELAINDQLVCDRNTVANWLRSLLHHGSGWSDGVLFAQSWRASQSEKIENLLEINELAVALQPSRERWLEAIQQGKAFCDAAAIWPNSTLDILKKNQPVLAVAAGTLFGATGIEKSDALASYLNAFTSNLVWICVRLIPLGQSEGLSIIAELETDIIEVTEKAMNANLGDLGGCAIVSDIASMNHENMTTRIFRS